MKLRYGYDFYKSADTCPLDQVVDALGLQKTIMNGRVSISCPCPNHDDEHPSTVISMRGPHANRWHCFACGESGDPLLLVLAVKEGITPSAYFETFRSGTEEDKKAVGEARDRCIEWLDHLFPGNILSTEETRSTKERMPEVPDWLWSKLGFKKPLHYPATWRNEQSGQSRVEYFPALSVFDRAGLILDKCYEVQRKNLLFCENLFKKFPDIDPESKDYIVEKINDENTKITEYTDALQAFLELPYHLMEEDPRYIEENRELYQISVEASMRGITGMFTEEEDDKCLY